jgi:hypothetical protein
MLQRFIWWVHNEPNAPATLVQATSALVSTVITGALCWITSRYMVLTRQQTIGLW